jgi:glycosyltransferase involved in cell wall biosynthesis
LTAPRLISVVIPVYDERDSLEQLVDELLPVMRTVGTPYEVIFIDDGSRDGSDVVLAGLAALHEQIRVIKMRSIFGKGPALTAGFTEAEGDVIITLDADLQDDPAEIPRMLAALAEGADLVSGWKKERHDPWNKRIPSKIFNATARKASGLKLHDLNCGFKAYRADVVKALAIPGEMYRFIPAIAASEGFTVVEIPVNHRARQHGTSKYGFERYLRGMLDLVTISIVGRFRHRPMHLFGGAGLLLFFIGVLIGIYLTVLKFFGEAIGGRPLLILAVLLIVVGVQLFTLGLVSELIQRGRLRSEEDEAASRIERIIEG